MLSIQTCLINIPEALRIGVTNMDKMQKKQLSSSYVTVCICLQGCAIFNINFRQYRVQKNDLIVLYDDTFAMLQAKSRCFNLEYLLIDKKLATSIAYSLPQQLFAFFNDYPIIQIPIEKHELFDYWKKIMFSIAIERGEYWQLQLKNHLQNLFLEISNGAKTILVKPEKRNRQEQLCWRFWGLITRHCKQHKEVKFYAERLSITPFYLSKISQSFFNDPPKALIDRQVILEIKALLEIGKLSIKEIADEVNFEDTSYLCRYFKRHTGITLTEFKKGVRFKTGKS
ncbi:MULTISPECIES: helix-turn-helix domain-containing protein [Providencia]|uniref:helix-turn-helix domain-containing protein n=1 Tax=Providencia TaxID=586 RepID=UPI0019811E81|nr:MULTISPECIES: helix-turn-helix domain-containing protein [Providencia]MBN4864967.1 AraC family transcriptional regulator [Providencia stuartii]MBN4874808.1 AraC family transcriptional regulator [Providencia stuartii]MBN4878979.1 AraC family transcriptional regulator [Providencia stuartii]MBN4884008.1 AraC family transcriptional regulator [Providencia stuartii]HEM8290937.1 AraC family transcriptional regulator [Providencia stuartii]